MVDKALRADIAQVFQRAGIVADDKMLDLYTKISQRHELDGEKLLQHWLKFAREFLLDDDELTIEIGCCFEIQTFSELEYAPDFYVNRLKELELRKKADQIKKGIKRSFDEADHDSMPSTSRKSSRKSPSPFPPLEEDLITLCSYGSTDHSWKPTRSDKECCEINDIEMKLIYRELEYYNTPQEMVKDSLRFIEDIESIVIDRLIEFNKLPSLSSYLETSNESSYFVGQIINEKNDLIPSNIKLKGTGSYQSERILVDITQVSEYFVYPGQFIAVKGMKNEENKVLAEELYTEAPPLKQLQPTLTVKLQIIVAAGPFVNAHDLDCTRLMKLLQRIQMHDPDYVFLVGPFYFGELKFRSSRGSNSHELKKYFEKFIQMFSKLRSKVHCVLCCNDVFLYPSLPSPIFGRNGWSHIFLPDPSNILLDLFNMGFVTPDVLAYLKENECTTYINSDDKLARYCEQFITQQSFFPGELNVITPTEKKHTDRFYTCSLVGFVPHIIMLSSEEDCFVKEVRGCLFINTKKCVYNEQNDFRSVRNENMHNYFTQIEVRPPNEEGWSVKSHVSARICRV